MSRAARRRSADDPMRTDRDEIVSTEVYMNAAYGYHVHAELVGRREQSRWRRPRSRCATRTALAGSPIPRIGFRSFADAIAGN